ncbi:MAG: shikimate dehydrogenase, partial [Clostridia bacterium]|nr:shikimate dehydrogenase [Clostridia bacterium]
LKEISKDELSAFMEAKEFSAINVTIPYKEAVIPHLYSIDEAARSIGAVNTIVNKDGRLFGYNTDFYGMTRLLSHAGVIVTGKKVAILGSGGTAKTARAVCLSLGAREVLTVSRREGNGAIDYSTLYERHTDTEVIINTTPVGMYPSPYEVSLDISGFDKLTGVIDAIYNPLRTELVLSALDRGIPAEGGLYMLVAQAVRASEIFLDTKYPEEVCDRVYERILKEKENIVLIGMPGSGKSTVAELLKESLSRRVCDTDEIIKERCGKDIPAIFREDGEARFREIEAEVVREVSKTGGRIISTGGGAILQNDNVKALKMNGKVYFLDRPKEDLVPTEDRPLAQTREMIYKRYDERYAKYTAAADRIIKIDCPADEVAKRIENENLRA